MVVFESDKAMVSDGDAMGIATEIAEDMMRASNARRIQQVSPNSKILFVSENRSPEIVEGALSTGAGGYVIKSDGATELLPAIKAVLEGKRFISASLAGHFLVATGLATQITSWIVTLISSMS